MKETPQRHLVQCHLVKQQVTMDFSREKNNLKAFSNILHHSAYFWLASVARLQDMFIIFILSHEPFLVHLFWPMSHIGAWHQSVALQLGHENTRSLNSETSELTTWSLNIFVPNQTVQLHSSHVVVLFLRVGSFPFPKKTSWPASHRLDLHMGQRDSWVKAISTVFWHVPHFWNTFFWNSEGLWYQYRCSSQFCYETNNLISIRIWIYNIMYSL